jgi:hypothetical protein
MTIKLNITPEIQLEEKHDETHDESNNEFLRTIFPEHFTEDHADCEHEEEKTESNSYDEFDEYDDEYIEKSAEDWRFVKGYENLYEVSNLGNIRRYGASRLRKYTISNMGYYRIYLTKNNTRKGYYVHRIVAEVFLENPDNLPHIIHISRCKLDNNAINLRYVPCGASMFNRTTNNHGYTYKYIDELPAESVQIKHFGNNRYDRLYYSKSTETFYKFIDEEFGYHDILIS